MIKSSALIENDFSFVLKKQTSFRMSKIAKRSFYSAMPTPSNTKQSYEMRLRKKRK